MKIKIFLSLSLILNFINFNAQNIQKIIASTNGNHLTSIEVYTEEHVFVLNENGYVGSISSKQLNGNLDYFDNEQLEKEKYGKVKSFGDIKIEYWLTSNERDARYGKIKRVGTIAIDYYDSFNYEPEKFGKVKSIGMIPIDYWKKDGFDVDKSGKLKSIGTILIDYYDYEPMNNSKYGKIKFFGPVKFEYWDDYYRDKGKLGKLKSITGNSDKILVKLIMNDSGGNGRYVPY